MTTAACQYTPQAAEHTSPTLLVIHGSTRSGRRGFPITEAIVERLQGNGQFTVQLADLAEIDLPLMDEPHHPRMGRYQHEHTKQWAQTVAAADAIMIVTSEYNHFLPASVKNALDYLFAEWQGKPLAIVSYGGRSGGGRAADQLHYIALDLLDMRPAEQQIAITGVADRFAEDGSFPLDEELAAQVDEQARQLLELLSEDDAESAEG